MWKILFLCSLISLICRITESKDDSGELLRADDYEDYDEKLLSTVAPSTTTQHYRRRSKTPTTSRPTTSTTTQSPNNNQTSRKGNGNKKLVRHSTTARNSQQLALATWRPPKRTTTPRASTVAVATQSTISRVDSVRVKTTSQPHIQEAQKQTVAPSRRRNKKQTTTSTSTTTTATPPRVASNSYKTIEAANRQLNYSPPTSKQTHRESYGSYQFQAYSGISGPFETTKQQTAFNAQPIKTSKQQAAIPHSEWFAKANTRSYRPADDSVQTSTKSPIQQKHFYQPTSTSPNVENVTPHARRRSNSQVLLTSTTTTPFSYPTVKPTKSSTTSTHFPRRLRLLHRNSLPKNRVPQPVKLKFEEADKSASTDTTASISGTSEQPIVTIGNLYTVSPVVSYRPTTPPPPVSFFGNGHAAVVSDSTSPSGQLEGEVVEIQQLDYK